MRMKNKAKKLVDRQRDEDSMKKKSTTYCITCSKSRCKGDDTKLYRISEQHSAKKLLSAARLFKDDVQTRSILWKTPSDVFVTDVSK